MSVTPQAAPNPATTDWIPLWQGGNPSVPAARVYNVSAQNAAAGLHVVTFDSERYDTDGIHDTVTNPSRLTCRTAGKYMIGAHIAFGASTASLQVLIRLNGTTYLASQQTPVASTQMSISTCWDLDVGNYVEFYVAQGTGAPLAIGISPAYSPEFWMTMVAPPLGSPFPTGPKVTTGPIASGPPASPVDGDIWIATDVNLANVRWHFQYNASSASPYKWEFIGGPPANSYVGTAEFRTTGGYGDLATVGPRLQVARAGEYSLDAAVTITKGQSAAVFTGLMQIYAETQGTVLSSTASFAGIGNTGGQSIARVTCDAYPAPLQAAEFVKLLYAANITTSDLDFRERRLRITPKRVS